MHATAGVRPLADSGVSVTVRFALTDADGGPGSDPHRPTVRALDQPRQPGLIPRGRLSNQAQLVAVRVAHQAGFDRLVFEFGPSTAPGPFGMPAYIVEAASSLSGPSGQPVTIAGSAIFGTRFQNASTISPSGTPSYTGSTDMKPSTPLIKQVRLVEDFERVLVWGTGLDHLACPKVSELAGPYRVVLDFPTPP